MNRVSELVWPRGTWAYGRRIAWLRGRVAVLKIGLQGVSLNRVFRVRRATSHDGLMSETSCLGAPVLGSTNSVGGKTPDPRR